MALQVRTFFAVLDTSMLICLGRKCQLGFFLEQDPMALQVRSGNIGR